MIELNSNVCSHLIVKENWIRSCIKILTDFLNSTNVDEECEISESVH